MGYGVQVGMGHSHSGHQGVCVSGCLADQAEKKLHPSPAGFSLFTVQSVLAGHLATPPCEAADAFPSPLGNLPACTTVSRCPSLPTPQHQHRLAPFPGPSHLLMPSDLSLSAFTTCSR